MLIQPGIWAYNIPIQNNTISVSVSIRNLHYMGNSMCKPVINIQYVSLPQTVPLKLGLKSAPAWLHINTYVFGSGCLTSNTFYKCHKMFKNSEHPLIKVAMLLITVLYRKPSVNRNASLEKCWFCQLISEWTISPFIHVERPLPPQQLERFFIRHKW